MAVLFASFVCFGCAEESIPWNVLVIVPDAVRPDHLSVNGYTKRTTPYLERFAAEGVNFTQAVSSAARTWQSFASILTGLYPPRHGVRYIFDDPVSPGTPMLQTELAKRGYRTAIFDRGGISELSGRSFDEHVDRIGPEPVLEWILARDAPPFLAFVWLPGAHWPYEGVEWLEDPADCEQHDHDFNAGGTAVRRTREGMRLSRPAQYRRLVWTPDTDEETRAHRISHYDAEVRETDASIEAIVEGLRASGVLARTIVLVTSDHGESFGEHGYLQHGPRVDEPVMRVPLLLSLPETHPEHVAGVVVPDLVRTVDILPTLLAAAGVPIPEDLDGVSLLPLIRGEAKEALHAYGESGRAFAGMDPERYLPGVAGKHRMIRTERWKLVHIPRPDTAEERLYDLSADPGELRDVAAEHPDVVAQLRARLDAVLAQESFGSQEKTLTDGEIQRLRELGYTD